MAHERPDLRAILIAAGAIRPVPVAGPDGLTPIPPQPGPVVRLDHRGRTEARAAIERQRRHVEAFGPWR